jgi:septum formation protein
VSNPVARRLVLASTSPRRIHLLGKARYKFVYEPADIDEQKVAPSVLPSEMAMQIARAKAEKVGAKYPEDVILAADTIVALGDWVMGQPRDAEHAKKMIELLSGTTQIVITGVSVVCLADHFARHARVMSAVQMKSLTTAQIDRYIASKLWEGKAGGYGIQDPEPLVKCLGGDPTNVIGLPMKKTKEMLAEAGIMPGDPPADSSDQTTT